MGRSRADLPAFDPDSGLATAIVECRRGHRSKLKHDPKHDLFVLDRLLPEGVVFPYDFGFIPSTQGDDGDPVDILILLEEPQYPGCVVPTRLIGVIEARQTERDGTDVRNDRLIGAAASSTLFQDVQELGDVSADVVDQIEAFFVASAKSSGKVFHPLGRHGADRAHALVEAGIKLRRRRRSRRGP